MIGLLILVLSLAGCDSNNYVDSQDKKLEKSKMKIALHNYCDGYCTSDDSHKIWASQEKGEYDREKMTTQCLSLCHAIIDEELK